MIWAVVLDFHAAYCAKCCVSSKQVDVIHSCSPRCHSPKVPSLVNAETACDGVHSAAPCTATPGCYHQPCLLLFSMLILQAQYDPNKYANPPLYQASPAMGTWGSDANHPALVKSGTTHSCMLLLVTAWALHPCDTMVVGMLSVTNRHSVVTAICASTHDPQHGNLQRHNGRHAQISCLSKPTPPNKCSLLLCLDVVLMLVLMFC